MFLSLRSEHLMEVVVLEVGPWVVRHSGHCDGDTVSALKFSGQGWSALRTSNGGLCS
jgi:hypothetical protein